jgi:hypothetical protein
MRILLLPFIFLFHVCWAQTGIVEIGAHTGNYYKGITSSLRGKSCSLACVMKWKLTASSEMAGNETGNMNDGLPKTSWIEGKAGDGEKLFARLNGNGKVRDVSFWGIRIANGDQQDSVTWKAYSRVKRLKVYHNAIPVLIVNFEDKMGVETAKWKPNLMRLNDGDLITFEILEIYKGDIYNNVAISDLVLDGAH